MGLALSTERYFLFSHHGLRGLSCVYTTTPPRPPASSVPPSRASHSSRPISAESDSFFTACPRPAARLRLPLRAEMKASRGQTCIFDRGADHLEPAEIKQRCLPPCFSSCSLPSIHSSFFPRFFRSSPLYPVLSLEVSLVHRR